MYSLLLKEVRSLFNSMIAYLVMIVFLGVNAFLLWLQNGNFNLLDYGYANLDHFFYISPYVFLILIPALGMRTISEEYKSGTLSFLLSRPIAIYKIVLAKFLAVKLLVLLSLIATFVYIYTIHNLGAPAGNLDLGAVITSYVGLMLLASAFIAISIFASALSSNQIVGFIVSLLICFFIFSGLDAIGFEMISGLEHYRSISRGVFVPSDFIFYLSLSAFFITLTVFIIKRYRKGGWLSKEFIKEVLIVSILFLGINFLGDQLKYRYDLTEDQKYSITDNSKRTIEDIDQPISINIYLTGDLPSGFQRLKRETQLMLEEIRSLNKDFSFNFVDLNRISDQEIRNNRINELIEAGLQPTNLQVKTRDGVKQQLIFPGAIIRTETHYVAIQLLQSSQTLSPEEILNNSIAALEFSFMNGLNRLLTDDVKTIAFLSGHGELEGNEILSAKQELAKDYRVAEVSSDDLWKLKDQIDILIINQPKKRFEEKDKYVIDQFVMMGGKVIWAIDPVDMSLEKLQTSETALAFPYDLNLDDLLFQYGVRMNPNLVMDLNSLSIPLRTGEMGGQAQIEFFPWFYYPVLSPLSSHSITKNLNAIMMNFASQIDLLQISDVEHQALLMSSNMSRIKPVPSNIDFQILNQKVNHQDYESQYLIGVISEGNFKSAFNNRIPPIDSEVISESKKTSMVLIADGDVFRNQLHSSQGYPLPLGFDQYTNKQFGNQELLLNIVSYLSGSEDLISLRSKDLKLRLLNKAKISESRNYWMFLNTLLPIAFILIIAFLQYFLRRRKYQ